MKVISLNINDLAEGYIIGFESPSFREVIENVGYNIFKAHSHPP